MHFLDLFPELHFMIRCKLDMYSAMALDMTCHFFWDCPRGLPMRIPLHFGRDKQATKDWKEQGVFDRNYVANITFHAHSNYIGWAWWKQCISDPDKIVFFQGLIIRNEVPLFRHYWQQLEQITPPQAKIWTDLYRFIYKSNKSAIIHAAIELGLYLHVGAPNVTQELQWVLDAGGNEDAKPDKNLVLKLFDQLPPGTRDRVEDLPYFVLLISCLAFGRMDTFFELCVAVPDLRRCYVELPACAGLCFVLYGLRGLKLEHASRLNERIVYFMEAMVEFNSIVPVSLYSPSLSPPLMVLIESELAHSDLDVNLFQRALLAARKYVDLGRQWLKGPGQTNTEPFITAATLDQLWGPAAAFAVRDDGEEEEEDAEEEDA